MERTERGNAPCVSLVMFVLVVNSPPQSPTRAIKSSLELDGPAFQYYYYVTLKKLGMRL